MNDDQKELIVQIVGDKSLLTGSLYRDMICDYEKLDKNTFHVHTIIGEIVERSQKVEELMLLYLSDNGIEIDATKFWEKASRRLLNRIKTKGLFPPEQIEMLRKIIELRDWVIHDYYKEQRAYLAQQSQGKSDMERLLNPSVNIRKWIEFSNAKLAATKNLLNEAIDFIYDKTERNRGRSGVTNIIDGSGNPY